MSGAALGASVALIGLGVPGFVVAGGAFYGAVQLRDRRPVMRTEGGQIIRRGEARRAFLLPGGADGWRVALRDPPDGDLILQGPEALRALRALLPRINWGDWHRDHLTNAVSELERVGSADRLIRMAVGDLANLENFNPRYRWSWPRADPAPYRIQGSTPVIPLALAIAANEEAERRALEGELRSPEREWRAGEALAGIADNLLFPGVLRTKLRDLGRSSRGPET